MKNIELGEKLKNRFKELEALIANEITSKKIEAYKKFFNDYGLQMSSSDYNFLQKQYLKLTQ